jgi:inner membrane protein
MATILSHAVVAAAIGSAFPAARVPKMLWISGGILAMVPDLDVVGFAFGVHYADFWGHRGFTHSLCFAAALAVLMTVAVHWRRAHKRWIAAYLFLATASHGVLDALTDGGLGVAFFSPFDDGRYFFPVRPIAVSPIGAGFFSERGLAVLRCEALWILLPSALVIASCLYLHRREREPADQKDAA